MKSRKSPKTVILSLAIATAGLIGSLGFAQATRGITLELFAQIPNESSSALSSVEIQDSGSLAELNAAELARQARYLRVTVNQDGQMDVRVYRVLINPNNGRTFIISGGKATALDNLLRQSGLEVAKDNMEVTMGSDNIDLQVEGLAPSEAASAPAATETAASTTASSTETSTPAASSTEASSSSSTTTTTAPSTAESAPASGEAQPLTAEVKQDLGKLALTVLPTSGAAPASNANSFYVLPFTDATNPTQSVADDVVTLDYASAAKMEDVIAFHDKLMADQGFEKVADDVANTSTENEYIQVYKRGNAIVTLTVSRDANGKYTVTVDLGDLVQSLGQ